TFAAVFMTPLLTAWLAGAMVEVDPWRLFRDTCQVVLLPVVSGVAINHCLPRVVQKAQRVLPLVSVVVIALICASIIGQSAPAVKDAAARLLGAVATLHLGGFALGYLVARLALRD